MWRQHDFSWEAHGGQQNAIARQFHIFVHAVTKLLAPYCRIEIQKNVVARCLQGSSEMKAG